VGLKAWHIYGLILIPVVLLLIGVTYGANERDGTERTVEQARANGGEDEPVPPGPEGSGDDQEPEGPGGPAGGPSLRIVAIDNEFDQTELTAPADQEVTLELINDGNSLHNWAIPDEDIATDLIGGGETATVTFTLPAGDYGYLCEVHPETMTGTLIVQ
jgi:plastocyanin